MALVPRLNSTNNNNFIIPDTLNYGAGTITAIYGSQSYSLGIGSPTSNQLYFVYVSSAGLAQSTTIPSTYMANNPGSLLTAAYQANNASSFGSFINIEGTPTSEWIDCGQVPMGASTTPPSVGTATYSANSLKLRRSGDTAEVSIMINKTGGTANNGSGQYIYQLPSGLSIDLSKYPAATGTTGGSAQPTQSLTAVGFATFFQGGTTWAGGYIGVYDSTGVSAYVNDQLANSGSAQSPVGSGYLAFNTNAATSITYRVAVSGWSIRQLKDL